MIAAVEESAEVSVEGAVDAAVDDDDLARDPRVDDASGDRVGGGGDVDATSGEEARRDPERGDGDGAPPLVVDPRFDHTSRKVVVHNVLKYMRHGELRKMVDSWLVGHESKGIVIVSTKKPPRDNWVKLTFEREDMVDPFIHIINAGGENGMALSNGRGRSLFAKRADEIHRDRDDCGGRRDENANCGRKRKGRDVGDDDGDDDDDNDVVDGKGREDDANNNDRKRSRTSSSHAGGMTTPPSRVLTSDEVRDAITPLWKMTYEEQLDGKMREMVNKCAKVIIKEIRYKFKVLERESKRGQRKSSIVPYDWLNQLRAIEMDQVIPSPLRTEYRNKCEFTIGYRTVPTTTTTVEGGDGEYDGTPPTMAAVDGAVVGVGDDDGGEVVMAVAAEADAAIDPPHASVNITTTTSTTTTSSSTTPNVEYRRVPAAGFLPQGWNGGIYPPHSLQNMPDWSCGIADVFDEFLPTSSLPPYDSRSHRGVWRTVTVRCSLRTRECMIVVLHAPPTGGAGARDDGSDDYTTSFEDEKARLVDMLTRDVIPTPTRDYPDGHARKEMDESACGDGGGGGIRVTSIYFQEYEGLSLPTPDHPVQHIYGKKYIEERLGKCTFQISPGAFFQTNTEGAEVLYNIVLDRIREVTTDPKRTLLLDVCCGTGTIGLTCLKEGVVGALVGVDIAEPAIADARINAERNGFRDVNTADDVGVAATTRFVASAAEKVLPEVMRDISSKGMPGDTTATTTTEPIVVAVVDPARDGLHGIVVRTLRANEKIQRLIYVSCNPVGTLTRDAAMLCCAPTNKYPGLPFKVSRSQPVDMFPMTKHCEMVMTFDRMSKEEYEKCQT